MYTARSQPATLLARQSNNSSGCNCISGGSIAGIVIGSIGGTLLILWLIYTVRAESYISREASSAGGSGGRAVVQEGGANRHTFIGVGKHTG